MRIVPYRLTATIAAAASTATATFSDSKRSLPRGKVLAVEVNYPSHTVALTLIGTNDTVSQTLLNLSAASTDLVVYPRVPITTNASVAITYDGTRAVYTEYLLYGDFVLSLASGTAGDSVTVTVYVEEQ